MRAFATVVAVAALGVALQPASAEQKIRLTQSGVVTSCMMTCNAAAAACQTNCVVPGTAPSSAATTTSNATASTACLLACNATQLV